MDKRLSLYVRQSEVTYSVVSMSGEMTPRNDTASVAQLDDDSLLAVWHKYRNSDRGSSDFGKCDIAAKRSHDGGLTWQDEERIVACAPSDNNVQAPALRKLRNGDILLVCLRGHVGGESSTMDVLRSVDGGYSFQQQNPVWQKSAGQWLQGGSTSLLQLQSGRLLLPFHGGAGHQASQHNVIHCYYSDDDGETWNRNEQALDLPMRGAMESSVAELPNRELVMSMRTQLGSVFLSRSNDEGENWQLAQTTGLKAPESSTCLRAIPNTEDLILLWNDSWYDPVHHHYGLRSPLSIALSKDQGSTWHKVGDLASHQEYNFTNIGCDWLNDEKAIISYSVYGPNRICDNGRSGWDNPDVFDLHTAIIDKDWIYSK